MAKTSYLINLIIFIYMYVQIKMCEDNISRKRLRFTTPSHHLTHTLKPPNPPSHTHLPTLTHTHMLHGIFHWFQLIATSDIGELEGELSKFANLRRKDRNDIMSIKNIPIYARFQCLINIFQTIDTYLL